MYQKDTSQCTFTVYTNAVQMTTHTEDQFGEWLRHWRRVADLTQEQLGQKVGVKKQHISNLERGEKSAYTGKTMRPSLELVVKLAKALNRPITEAIEKAEIPLPVELSATPQTESIEQTLRRAQTFEGRGLTEAEIERLRPLMEVLDREIERLTQEKITEE